MASSVSVTVNGVPRRVEAAPDTPLLLVLRNDLRLYAAKFGCGLGQCGACTVHLDGRPVRACVTPLAAAAGHSVVTLEGLSTDERLHPLQQAFLDEQAAQCGYCLNGMIMTAAALVTRTPKPSDADLRRLLDGNLCRCGAHLRILRAIRRVLEA